MELRAETRQFRNFREKCQCVGTKITTTLTCIGTECEVTQQENHLFRHFTGIHPERGRQELRSRRVALRLSSQSHERPRTQTHQRQKFENKSTNANADPPRQRRTGWLWYSASAEETALSAQLPSRPSKVNGPKNANDKEEQNEHKKAILGGRTPSGKNASACQSWGWCPPILGLVAPIFRTACRMCSKSSNVIPAWFPAGSPHGRGHNELLVFRTSRQLTAASVVCVSGRQRRCRKKKKRLVWRRASEVPLRWVNHSPHHFLLKLAVETDQDELIKSIQEFFTQSVDQPSDEVQACWS